MQNNYCKYTDQAQNLEHLAEEAAEIIRIKSKCIRFGLNDYHPKNHEINRIALAHEIGHFITMVEILIEHGIIDRDEVIAGQLQKIENLKQWYNYNRKPI